MTKSGRSCVVCGAAFQVKRRRAPTRTCSKKCQYTQIAESNRKRVEANRPERNKKLQRICVNCGETFQLSYTTSLQRFCSPACNNSGASDEANAKRSASIKAFNAANPGKSAARIRKAHKGFMRWLSDPINLEIQSSRARAVMENLLADGSIQEANKQAMKRAHEELRASTSYNEVFCRTQERLRLEFPYDGPGEWSDYHEYIIKLGRMTTRDPELMGIAVSFFKAEMPRFMREEHEKRKEGELAA